MWNIGVHSEQDIFNSIHGLSCLNLSNAWKPCIVQRWSSIDNKYILHQRFIVNLNNFEYRGYLRFAGHKPQLALHSTFM